MTARPGRRFRVRDTTHSRTTEPAPTRGPRANGVALRGSRWAGAFNETCTYRDRVGPGGVSRAGAGDAGGLRPRPRAAEEIRGSARQRHRGAAVDCADAQG